MPERQPGGLRIRGAGCAPSKRRRVYWLETEATPLQELPSPLLLVVCGAAEEYPRNLPPKAIPPDSRPPPLGIPHSRATNARAQTSMQMGRRWGLVEFLKHPQKLAQHSMQMGRRWGRMIRIESLPGAQTSMQMGRRWGRILTVGLAFLGPTLHASSLFLHITKSPAASIRSRFFLASPSGG